MHTEYIIIGQGISGTWLSYYLQKANKSFLVIDNNQHNSASRVAAGIINPVTGRRIVKTWMIDELLSHLIPAYEKIGNELGITGITQKNVIDFHPTPQMKIAFDERLKEDETNLRKPTDENIYRNYFNYEFGFGEVNPCYVINLQEILSGWRKKLETAGNLLNEDFNLAELKLSDNSIQYKNIIAEKIIFCDGQASATNTFFKNLPFSLNKGEALIIESTEIPSTHVFKKGMMLTPLQGMGANLFWIGSNYLWDFADDQPTPAFKQQTEALLKNWLKVPYKIVDHKAAVRPANIERRPFVGFHPVYKNVGILNGMGTKGCSLAPYFAKQLTEHLVNKTEISTEANITRFEKILTRN
jgi:glycine/D-amino acid oxidase-like deaminating enzyme